MKGFFPPEQNYNMDQTGDSLESTDKRTYTKESEKVAGTISRPKL